ncbi:MAG TPA: hypothetical protein VKH46_02965 [Thermoanaerobaculia bacterium]|jgi:hypothetical protein|nr:hypothetical protein [Thermoanaerobaculia bacterium]
MERDRSDEQEILAQAPRGTFALMLIVGFLLFAGWAALYFGRFLADGPVR